VEYRASMLIGDFGRKFSVDPSKMSAKKKQDSWTWHDKTPFPWEKIMQKGVREGLRHPSADQLLSQARRVEESAAKRVRDDLQLKAEPLRDMSHMSDVVRNVIHGIAEVVGDALNKMRK